jgi:hypothetical protein
MLDNVGTERETAVSEMTDPSITSAQSPPTLICHNGSANILASCCLISVIAMTVWSKIYVNINFREAV